MEVHMDSSCILPAPNLIFNAEYPMLNKEEKVADYSNPSITSAKYWCSKASTFCPMVSALSSGAMAVAA